MTNATMARMAQLLDMYRLIKIVRKVSKKEEEELNKNVLLPGVVYLRATPPATDIRAIFKKKYRWVKDDYFNTIFNQADKEGYITKLKADWHGYPVDSVKLELKGFSFLDRYHSIPLGAVGLWREWMKVNGAIWGFLGVGTIIGAVVNGTIALLIHHFYP